MTKQAEAQNVRQKFCSAYGDHVTLLNIFREFDTVGQNNRRTWCHEHFINMRNILHAREIRAQLEQVCKKCDLGVMSSCGGDLDRLRKCLVMGLFMNVAELVRDHHYITVSKYLFVCKNIFLNHQMLCLYNASRVASLPGVWHCYL